MNLRPTEHLSESQVRSGLRSIIADGMFAEAMIALTGGTFLVAMALSMGATNFQLGVLASMPTFCSLAQLVSIWFVKKYNNRRAVTVISNIFGRLPLFIIAILPFLFTGTTGVTAMIFVLFFHYFLGSVAGPAWNSWMKDLIPAKELGSYFSHRGRLTQILNVTLSLALAFGIDFVKLRFPDHTMMVYAGMFVLGGIFGMLGILALARTPEPKSYMGKENIFELMSKPLKDKNFRNLLIFNSAWAFALNIATPFFSVYMMKTMGLPLSYIIVLGILGQISSILSIKMWGRYSDRFSNKTIIRISAPIYVACIIAWVFTGNLGIPLLILINIMSGFSTAGINLALGNIGFKLAPKEEAIAYLTAKNMLVALASAVAPLIGGLMADFFATHQFAWNIEWKSASGTSILNIIDLKGWNFFFIIGGLLALSSLRLLNSVKEQGEVQKGRVVVYMRSRLRRNIRREAKRTIGLPQTGINVIGKKVKMIFN